VPQGVINKKSVLRKASESWHGGPGKKTNRVVAAEKDGGAAPVSEKEKRREPDKWREVCEAGGELYA